MTPPDPITRCSAHLSAASHSTGEISAYHLVAARSAYVAGMEALSELDRLISARELAMVADAVR